MAEWSLQGTAGWDRARIDQVMTDSISVRADLATPVGVLLFYTTATSMGDGTIRFYRDIYGHDEELAAQLSARS